MSEVGELQWLPASEEMVGVKEINWWCPRHQWGGPGNQWLGHSCSTGGDRSTGDSGEASSERSMCRAMGREGEDMAGEAEWTDCRKEMARGGESETERESERTIGKKRGMGKGEMASE